MALTYTVDFALSELVEPGFWQRFTTRDLADSGAPTDDNAYKDVWRDEATKTIMLRPLQFNPDFLNTTQQYDSILRLDDMTVSAADIANTSIFEQPAYGNTANPYIYHVPVGPSGAFPAAMPSAPPSLTGVSTPYDLTDVSLTSQYRDLIYSQPTVPEIPPYSAPVQIGDSTNGKIVGESKERLLANQGLFLRWSQPASMPGYPLTYDILIGQFCLRLKEVMCEVFQDTSAGGDRTKWQKIARYPLWTVSDVPVGVNQITSMATPATELAHDRYLLWLPFRKNQVLLQSNLGKWGLLTVRHLAKRLADNSDWDIVRSDTVAVRVLTQSPGRIQIQKLKYATGGRKIQSPTATVNYTPSVAPTITLTTETDHGTTITAVRSQPPAYTLPVNVADDCPPVTTDPATDQSRTYGVELTLNASTDGRWTPYFYGFELATARTFGTRPTTPLTVSDSSSATYYLQEATIASGIKPGEGRLSSLSLVERTPFNFSSYYYRSYYPVQLSSGGTAVFTGWSEPNEVKPWKEGSARTITLSAVDRWKQLTDTWLQDQRDWSGYGHIDVVLFVAQQGGVDTTGAEVPAGYVAGTLNSINTPLNLGDQTTDQAAGDLHVAWKPKDEDTAASYIQRVAEVFSGWDVGFYPNGQFFYRPRDYFTTSEFTFNSTTAGGSPVFRNANFRTIEPEANVIIVKAGTTAGGHQYSALWVDWASIKNPAVVNYIGKWRAEAVQIDGAMTCAQLNLAARTIFQQTRRRRRTIEFDAEFIPGLKVGHVCTVGSYGDYRVESYQVQFKKDQWRDAHYTAVLLEKGYGL